MKTRNIAVDIYKIICMFLITTIHVILYSGLDLKPLSDVNWVVAHTLNTLQVFSISGFTLISAYFLIDKTDTLKKVISFMIQLIFISALIFVLSLIFISRDISLKIAVKSLFPILSAHYWYPANYLFLLVMAPFLNKFIRALTKGELLSFIVVFSFFSCVFYHLNPCWDIASYLGHHTHNLLWFILLYVIAAYIKLYGVKKPVLCGPVCFFLCGILIFLLRTFLKKYIPEDVDILSFNSVISLIFTVSSFICFTNMKITAGKITSKIMSLIMPALFFVYLIQEHIAVRDALWDFVDITRWSHSLWLLPVIILVFAALLAIAIILSLIYKGAHKLILKKAEDIIFNIIKKVVYKKSV